MVKFEKRFLTLLAVLWRYRLPRGVLIFRIKVPSVTNKYPSKLSVYTQLFLRMLVRLSALRCGFSRCARAHTSLGDGSDRNEYAECTSPQRSAPGN